MKMVFGSGVKKKISVLSSGKISGSQITLYTYLLNLPVIHNHLKVSSLAEVHMLFSLVTVCRPLGFLFTHGLGDHHMLMVR